MLLMCGLRPAGMVMRQTVCVRPEGQQQGQENQVIDFEG